MMPAKVIDCIEALGLRTFGRELENPKMVIKRPVFLHKAVLQLYKIEIPALFGLLLRDEGISLERYDANLFDKELEDILRNLGPKIWPDPRIGKRDHLRQPKKGTLYHSELVYPRDEAILKQNLRHWILAKQSRPDLDVDALIQKKGERRVPKGSRTTPVTPNRGRAIKRHMDRVRNSTTTDRHKRPLPSESSRSGSESDSENSVAGALTRQRVSVRNREMNTTRSHNQALQAEVRLYRATSLIYGQVYPLGSISLTEQITCDECFSKVCQHIESDCSFLIFRFPEDMSPEPEMRIYRGSRDSERNFQRVLDILRTARKFPGDAPRAVEAECGLDLF